MTPALSPMASLACLKSYIPTLTNDFLRLREVCEMPAADLTEWREDNAMYRL